MLVGHIYANVLGNGPLIVAACSTTEEKEIAHYTVLHDSGEYELMVGQGTYYVFAFWDKNSNLIYEPGEPARQFGDPNLVVASTVSVVADIDVVIPDEGINIVIPHGKYQFDKIYFTAHSMGGLVARSLIIKYGSQIPYVKLLISLATPWGGDIMAQYNTILNKLGEKPSVSFHRSGENIKIHFAYNYDIDGGRLRPTLLPSHIDIQELETN